MITIAQLTAKIPTIKDSEVSLGIAKALIAGKTPYAAAKEAAETSDVSQDALYSRARRIAEHLDTLVHGDMGEMVANIKAGQVMMVPALRLAKLKAMLDREKVVVTTLKYIRVEAVVRPDEPPEEMEPIDELAAKRAAGDGVTEEPMEPGEIVPEEELDAPLTKAPATEPKKEPEPKEADPVPVAKEATPEPEPVSTAAPEPEIAPATEEPAPEVTETDAEMIAAAKDAAAKAKAKKAKPAAAKATTGKKKSSSVKVE